MNIFKNNTNIFDGKGFASKKENELKIKVNTLTKKGIKPKLVSIKIGENRDSDIYLTLKKKVADRIGIKMEVVNFSRKDDLLLILYSIQKLNKDASVHGIMIQLPIPDNFTALQKDTLIDAIDSKKDVDGMKKNSDFVTPVIQAVEIVASMSEEWIGPKSYPIRVAVVGAKGYVGEKIVKSALSWGNSYFVLGVDVNTKNLKEKIKSADIVVSATGKPNLITGDMVKTNAVVIDVGSPKGDVETESVVKRVCFLSAVPGGIGPVTIIILMENVYKVATKGV